jgi:stress response protein YsnF
MQMGNNTVVGVFDNSTEADRAVNDLVAAGIARVQIQITSNERATATSESVGGASRESEHEGLGDRIGHFFSRLFSSDDDREDATRYSEAVRRGSAVVTVNADSEQEADKAADILDDCGAVDINERAQEWRQSGWAGSPQSSAGGSLVGDDARVRDGAEKVIPVVKEEVQVGKRRRERGGVRIYTHTEDAPVEENVRLREEHARVERRPANRPANEADLAAFKEGTIEVRETIEEPVVAKKARVVEEVVVAKEASERTEKVRDSVRQGQVDVEKVDAGTSRNTLNPSARSASTYDDYDTDFRSHWQTNYARSGGAYEDYQPAYRYGSTLANDERYRNRSWTDIETDARRNWETHNPGSTWERFKAAVRHGWDRVTGKR